LLIFYCTSSIWCTSRST